MLRIYKTQHRDSHNDDIQHNDTHNNDTQHEDIQNDAQHDTQHNIYFKQCHFLPCAECLNTQCCSAESRSIVCSFRECRYVACRYAESRGAEVCARMFRATTTSSYPMQIPVVLIHLTGQHLLECPHTNIA